MLRSQAVQNQRQQHKACASIFGSGGICSSIRGGGNWLWLGLLKLLFPETALQLRVAQGEPVSSGNFRKYSGLAVCNFRKQHKACCSSSIWACSQESAVREAQPPGACCSVTSEHNQNQLTSSQTHASRLCSNIWSTGQSAPHGFRSTSSCCWNT